MAEDIKARIVFDTSGLGAIGAAVGTPASSGGSTGGSGGGMVGSLMGGLTKMALPIMAIKDIASAIMKGISFIAESSNMLKSVMGGIMKMLKLILKPIGDIFAIVLMPVLSIMRMVGLFFQVIMRPYIRKAMALVAVGNAQMGAGNITEGLEAFDLAATFMFTGFARAVSEGFAMVLGGLLDELGLLDNGAMILRDKVSGYFDAITLEMDITAIDMITKAAGMGVISERLWGNLISPFVEGDAELAAYAVGVYEELVKPLNDLTTFVEDTWGFDTAVKKVLRDLTGYTEGIETGTEMGQERAEPSFLQKLWGGIKGMAGSSTAQGVKEMDPFKILTGPAGGFAEGWATTQGAIIKDNKKLLENIELTNKGFIDTTWDLQTKSMAKKFDENAVQPISQKAETIPTALQPAEDKVNHIKGILDNVDGKTYTSIWKIIRRVTSG